MNLKSSKSGILLIALMSMATSGLHALPLVDWGNGTWSNGGPTQTGYGNGWTSGTTITEGLGVDVLWAASGSAAGVAENLTVSTVLSGGSDIPSLRLQQEHDANGASLTLANYTTLTLTFDSSVLLASPFTIYDVDQLGQVSPPPDNFFRDFISVTAYLGGIGGTALTTTYTPHPSNQTTTAYTLSGVQGIADAPNDTDIGNVDIDFGGGAFDTIVITFAQAPAGTSIFGHGIGISNIALVPEPNTAWFLGIAGAAFVALRCHRKRASGASA